MTEQRLSELLRRIRGIPVTVVGDFCLDKYLYVDADLDEPSLETGLTAYQVTHRRCSPGGAGNVCANLAALGADVAALGVLGKDGEALELSEALTACGADLSPMLRDGSRCTPTYVKPMRSGPEGYAEMHRLDLKNFSPMCDASTRAVCDGLREAAAAGRAILAVDQFLEPDCGVINTAVRQVLTELATARPDLVIYADSRAFIRAFAGCTVKCNRSEVVRAMAPETAGEPDDDTVLSCGRRLYEAARRPVFVTLGGDGMLAFSASGAARVPALPVPGPYDFCGAGDSASSALVAALAAGATPEEAAYLGNLAASVTIRKIGITGTASPEEMLANYREYSGRE